MNGLAALHRAKLALQKRRWITSLMVLGALVGLKAILLELDPTVRVYLGDSMAFLYGAMDEGRLPEDRSFVYSFILRGLVYPYEDLSLIARWQSLVGVVIAVCLWVLLERGFRVRRAWAAVTACVFALEPAQLYYERMVLAETWGLLAFVLFVAAGAMYLARRTWWWLPIATACGLAAAALRLNYLPVVLTISLILPLLLVVDRARVAMRQLIAHCAVAVLSVVVLHGSYCVAVGEMFHVPAGYLPRAGFMQLGLVMPLVKAQQLERVGLPADIEQHLRYPLAEPDARMRHMWTPGGFIWELRQRRLDIEAIARPLSWMAITDDPLGLVRLGLHTTGDYFREEEAQSLLADDLGRRPIPYDVLWNLREKWGYDATDLSTRSTPVSLWFEGGASLLVLCLVALAPLSLLNLWAHWRTPLRLQALLAALAGLGLVLAHLLFVPVALYRYLHPLPFFVLLTAIPLAACTVTRASGGRT